MGVEVDNITGDIQTTVTTTSSTSSVTGPKTFMFGKKTGFVIPKNKLSGSLVPVFRPTKKGDGDSVNEEAPVQLQRKTKWGPDLTLDTTVRKSRALAYQTRINQISEQPTLGVMAVNDNQDYLSASEFNEGKSANHPLSTEETQVLELERREIIGEILELNPSYKAPASYKPILKEEKVPISIREYPGYNFIGVLFGPASDTLKRLEKETGAKIRVYGIKADTRGKVEITSSDRKEITDAYEDLYVHVSADTFGKVDAAVALIELLVTPVSMNPVSVSSTSTAAPDENTNAQPSQSTPSSVFAPDLLSQGTAQQQPYTGSFQTPQWFHTQNTNYPHSGSLTPTIYSGALHNNPIPVSSSSFNPTNNTSLFNQRPFQPTSLTPVMQNPSLVHSRPLSPNALPPQYIQQPPLPGQNGGPRNPQLSLTGPRQIMSTSQGPPTNFNAMTQVPFPGHNRPPPPLNVPNNMISPVFGPFHSSGASPGQQSQGGFPHSPVGPVQPAMPRMHAPGPNFVSGPNSFSGNAPNTLSPAIPGPSYSDFKFQPHRPPYSVSPPAWQNSQTGPPPSMRSAIHNFEPPQPPRPHMNQLRAQIANFGRNPLGPPRHPALLGPNGPGSPSFQHNMQPRNFIQSQSIGNLTSPFPPRQGNNQMQPQQNYRPFGATQPPMMFSGPHQHFGNRPFGGASGVQQVYDPFTPRSAHFNPQMGNNNNNNNNNNNDDDAVKGCDESDPEYEDLMASVGVK